MYSKVLASMDEAVKDIHDGATVMIGGFGTGVPYNLIGALHRQGAKDLTVITIFVAMLRRPDVGILIRSGRIRTLIQQSSDQSDDGRPVAQGTFVERIRAGGAGIPAFYTPTSVGTLVGEGKEHRVFNGRTYVMETALTADFALISAWRADPLGNLQFKYTQRTLNGWMARAAKRAFVEVEEMAPVGEIDPNMVHLPGIFVEGVVPIPPAPEGFWDRPYTFEGKPTRQRITRGVRGREQ